MSSDSLRTRLILASPALMAWSSAAFGDTVSKDISVSATVVNACAIRSTNELIGGKLVRISCTRSVPPAAALAPHISTEVQADLIVVAVTF